MQINPGLFSLALAGFAAFTAAQPHGLNKHLKLKNRDAESSARSAVNARFQDGTINCQEFPSAFGALKTSWVNPQGWSGVQYIDDAGKWATNSECVEGAYCSYACPTGYSKSQWPSEQPADGQSIGGLLCKNGKLHRTRREVDILCTLGVTGTVVENNLDKSVAICRTDYPGTENMVVPTIVQASSRQSLTVPDAKVSYKWKGRSTSAQFYVNNAGVSKEEGCIWGDESGTTGNWAPLVFGTGRDASGNIFISVSRNHLCKKGANFNVKLIPGDGSDSECIYDAATDSFKGKLATNGVLNPGCTISGNAGATYELS